MDRFNIVAKNGDWDEWKDKDGKYVHSSDCSALEKRCAELEGQLATLRELREFDQKDNTLLRKRLELAVDRCMELKEGE